MIRGVEGFVLAGGASSRFGSNKALASWRGVPMLERALRALAALGLTPRIVSPDPRPYRAYDEPLVMGERAGRGPAEGVRAALLACAAPASLVLAADMPEVGVRTLTRLLWGAGDPARGGHTVPVVFRDGERIHPFPGLYPRSILGRLEALGEGASLQALLRDGARYLPWTEGPAQGGESLRNVNERGDLETGE